MSSWIRRIQALSLWTLVVVLGACGDDSPTEPLPNTIGPNGGTLDFAGGNVTLVFPAGAVSQNLAVTVQATSTFPPAPTAVLGTAYDFRPTGTQFDRPVQLTINYDPASLPSGVQASELKLYTVVGAAWQEVGGSTVNVTNSAVTGSIEGFSVFGILGVLVASVTVSPDSLEILVGDSAQLTATTTDARGNILRGRPVTWSSSDSTIARVDPTGWVTGVAVGSVTITASSEGKKGTAEIDVKTRVTHGPMVTAVTASSATIWFRVVPTARVQVEYAPLESDGSPLLSALTTTSEQSDYTGTITLTGLAENTVYSYSILVEGGDHTPSAGPTFKTFPSAANLVRVGILTDLFTQDTSPTPAIRALSQDSPDVLLVLGDWDHRNVSNLSEMRSMHRETRGDESVAGATFRDHILFRFPVAHVWDDHDYGNNNSDKTFPGRDEAVQAYDEYWPSYDRPEPRAGIWHSFSYAQLLEVFMLDLRSQRDPDTYKDPRFVPDYEKNSNREELRNDPERSILDGDERPEGRPTGQKQWLLEGLLASTAVWKVVASTVPWNPTVQKDDSWWDFQAEQRELLNFVREHGITGVIIVSGDIHTGGAIDDGRNAGLPELNVPTTNTPRQSTCNIHPDRQTTVFAGCGEWSHGLRHQGKGYGLISLDINSALLEAKDVNGAVVLDLRVGN